MKERCVDQGPSALLHPAPSSTQLFPGTLQPLVELEERESSFQALVG